MWDLLQINHGYTTNLEAPAAVTTQGHSEKKKIHIRIPLTLDWLLWRSYWQLVANRHRTKLVQLTQGQKSHATLQGLLVFFFHDMKRHQLFLRREK